MRKTLLAAAAAAVLILGGCTNVATKTDLAADDEGRARDYTLAQGLNVVEFDEFECSEPLKLCGPTGFRMIGGKEQDSIHIAMYNAEGDKVFEYDAENVKAFEGQQFRDEVTKFLEEQDVKATQAIVEGLVGLATKAVGL